MFAKLAFIASIAILAVATPTPNVQPESTCSTGAVQCCNSSGTASSSAISTLLGLLGIPIGSITGIVGVTCTPITAVGLGGSSCSTQTLCCDNDSFNGVVALGCTPITL